MKLKDKELWLELYEVAEKIQKLKPWKYLWDMDLLVYLCQPLNEIFYCQFLNFLTLLHRNMQLSLFGILFAEGLVPYYLQEVPYDRRKLQLPNQSDAASQPVSRQRKVKNPHHSKVPRKARRL